MSVEVVSNKKHFVPRASTGNLVSDCGRKLNAMQVSIKSHAPEQNAVEFRSSLVRKLDWNEPTISLSPLPLTPCIGPWYAPRPHAAVVVGGLEGVVFVVVTVVVVTVVFVTVVFVVVVTVVTVVLVVVVTVVVRHSTFTM